MPVWPGVLLCVLAPHPACIRYKVRPAWLVGGENGRKFAMRAQNTPKRAISSEQGEFYTAHAVRRGVLGEFYTGSGAVRLVQGEFYTEVARRDSCWGRCFAAAQSVCPVVGLPPHTGAAARPSGVSTTLRTGGVCCAGVLSGFGSASSSVVTP